MRILGYRPSVATVVAAVAVVIAVGSISYAAIPNSNGVIHGCYQQTSGNLRVVDTAGDCRNREQAIKWNQKGEPGPRGRRGRKGAAGPPGSKGDVGQTGPQGANGPVSGHELVAVHRIIPAYSGTGQAPEATLQATCPPGKKVTGGGYGRSVNQFAPDNVEVAFSYPADPTTWVIRVVSFSRDPVGVEVDAVCVNAD